MKMKPLFILNLLFLSIGSAWAQERVDIAIFPSSTIDQMEIRIRPSYAEAGTRYLTNAQFTIKWPVSSGINTITAGGPVFPYLLTPQGNPLTHDGYYYQSFATSGGFAISWAAGVEIVVQTFTFTSPPCPVFEIADDAFVQSIEVNGGFYFEINGADKTGDIYQAGAQQPYPGIPGAISGSTEIVPPQSGVVYTTSGSTNALSYEWSFSGTGAAITGTGTSVTIDFSETATSGNLTVYGVNGCGNSPAPATLYISVPNSQAAVVQGTYRYYGQVYCNDIFTPYTPALEGVTVVLQGTGYTSSTTTNVAGEYIFTDVPPGTYTVVSTYDRDTGGAVNALDAGQVNSWGVGPQYGIEIVRFKAGDAIYDNLLLAGDAGRINYYFLSMGNPGWNAPLNLWSFWKAGEEISANHLTESLYPVITVETTDVTQDFYGLVTGDFNQSMPAYLVPADPCNAGGE